jgi:phosphoribosylpyrophosphate synthetase
VKNLSLERPPDKSAIASCDAVESAAGITSGDIVNLGKRRTASGIVHYSSIGKIESKVIFADRPDTGGTLVSECEEPTPASVDELYIIVMPGLFTGQLWQNLESLPVKHIPCTDTIPACA